MSQDTTETTAEQTASTAPNIQIGDLVLTAQIIQLGAQRGIFKPEEFSQVGDFYQRLVGFLESTGAIQRAPAPGQAPAQPEGTPATPTEETPNA